MMMLMQVKYNNVPICPLSSKIKLKFTKYYENNLKSNNLYNQFIK